jgi:hypothetical protein
MEKEMTAEYANGYMAGVEAERTRITDLINSEMTSRPKPAPQMIEHWNKYLLQLINIDGRSKADILDEIAEELIDGMLNKLIERDEE